MKTILVTGGAGYVGSHACKALHHAGYLPVTFDNLSTGHAEAVRWGPLVRGDILDGAALRDAIDVHHPVAVMHFAASAYVGESVHDPGKYYRNNVAGTLTLVETMRDAGIDQFVFSSTCATYGVPDRTPIPEDHPQRPVNPYGATKLAVERMLADFHHAHGLRSVVLRYFNAAGADPAGEIGEWHEPETHLIPLAIEAAAGSGAPLTVFGDDHPTADGTCIRDYIHVSDLAQAHVLALGALLQGSSGASYNLGNGRGYSVREVLRTVREVTGLEVPANIGPARAGDPPALIGDAARITAELGWRPSHAELADIVSTAWAWHRQRLAARRA